MHASTPQSFRAPWRVDDVSSSDSASYGDLRGVIGLTGATDQRGHPQMIPYKTEPAGSNVLQPVAHVIASRRPQLGEAGAVVAAASSHGFIMSFVRSSCRVA
ncbi:hypothetical protein PIB30_013209 [Stylosanthes scabra]|uniref:Uncharacterized protein n=1 Tax=Stylosanthes scabra TaxID=79078 RepID=A0ABU6Q726_9FABA|nr:hypothetical protein [Stylosanthes scabra]